VELPHLVLEKVKDNTMCFGCGTDNPHGLKMEFYRDGEYSRSEFTPSEYHQSWPGYTHGGALMTVMDEAIGWVTFHRGVYSVTAKMEVRIKSMARIGEPLLVSAHIKKLTSRTAEVEADIKRRDGSVVAEASSIQYLVK
jgi:acyl-coenzyme A thioesterase PaaI-like protein